MTSNFVKDKDSKLDFKFDWSSWLQSGEKIGSFVITSDSGITLESSSLTDSSTSVTVWLSGGTEFQTYEVSCKITTDASTQRIDERTMQIKIIER